MRQTGHPPSRRELGRARMDWLLTLSVITASVLAARAFSRTRALTTTILALTARVEVLDLRLGRCDGAGGGGAGVGASEGPAVEAPFPEEAVVASPSPAQME